MYLHHHRASGQQPSRAAGRACVLLALERLLRHGPHERRHEVLQQRHVAVPHGARDATQESIPRMPWRPGRPADGSRPKKSS